MDIECKVVEEQNFINEPSLAVNFNKYIKIYDNAVSLDFCKNLIDKYKKNKNLIHFRNEQSFIFDEINISQSASFFQEEYAFLWKTFERYIERYKEDCKIQKYQFPEKYGFEEFRIKHYQAGEGRFLPHVDAGSKIACSRFLVFLLYLDSGESGGTSFIDENITSKRIAGRLLIFPPTWTFPHAGLIPSKTDKYIVGSYLQYTE
jgi:hypothetical protein